MTTIALVVALVALVGVAFLALAYSALVAIVRDVQDKLEGTTSSAPARRVDRFDGAGRSFVLVIEPNCLSCHERVGELAAYRRARPDASNLALTVLQAAPGSRPEGLPPDVDFLVDPELVGRLAVNVVPVGLVFDEVGTEIGRSVLGDPLSFERLITWADSSSDQVAAKASGRD